MLPQKDRQSFSIRLNPALCSTEIFTSFLTIKPTFSPVSEFRLGGIKNVEIQQKVHFKLYIK